VTGALAGCSTELFGSTVTRSFESDHDVSEDSVVTVTNRNGSVTVTDSADEKLRVSGEKRAASQDGLDSMAVEGVNGARVAVRVAFADGEEFSNRSVDLTVALPGTAEIERARTANGSIRASDVGGDLRAITTNGSVELRDLYGFVHAETTNGNVTVRNTTGLAGARSTNGNVDVELKKMDGDVDCVSSNGDVTVRVGPEIAAGFRLSTNTGNATIRDLDYTASVERERYIVGSLRDVQWPKLYLGTNNGTCCWAPADLFFSTTPPRRLSPARR